MVLSVFLFAAVATVAGTGVYIPTDIQLACLDECLRVSHTGAVRVAECTTDVSCYALEDITNDRVYQTSTPCSTEEESYFEGTCCCAYSGEDGADE